MPQYDKAKRDEGGVTVGIRMTISDTGAVTTDELLSQLPHSKFAKEVTVLRRSLLQMEALKSVIAVLAAKAKVSDEEVMTLLDVALAEELAE